jgi:Starch binding domain
MTNCTFILKMPIVMDLKNECLYLSGNIPELGMWNLVKAIKLTPQDSKGSIWQINLELQQD